MSSKGNGNEAETKFDEEGMTTVIKVQGSRDEPSYHESTTVEELMVSEAPTARHDSSSSSSDEDSDDDTTWRRGSRRRTSSKYQRTKWWFQESAVKKNCCVVIGTWALIVLGIVCFIIGVVLEIAYSHEEYRGIIFFAIGVLLIVPGVYAVLHVYLAARRVGRVRFTSVWFFKNSS